MNSELDHLAFDLFKLFAQYEYALKAMGYGRARKEGQAEPDWDRFANEVGCLVMALEDPSIVNARRYLFDHPPKRQVWVDGAVQWAPVSTSERTAQALFGNVRRVRNNLYHGGKFNGRWFDPDRSRDLIGHALIILRALVERDPKLKEAIQYNAG
jgi:hypothetical protein